MNKLATQPALDDRAMRKKVHEAEEEDGDGEGEESGKIGIHVFILWECKVSRCCESEVWRLWTPCVLISFLLLTQNAAFQCGTIENPKSSIQNRKLEGGPSRIRTYDQAIMRSEVYRLMRILPPITSKK